MPLTPIVSVKQNEYTRLFNGAFNSVPNTVGLYTPGAPLAAAGISTGMNQYPPLLWGVSGTFTGGGTGYSFAYAKGNSLFGAYYPNIVSSGSASGALSPDYSELLLTYEHGGITHPEYDYLATIPVGNNFALGPAPALSGPIIRPNLDHVGYGYSWGYLNGIAEEFGNTTDPLGSYVGRYIIQPDSSLFNAWRVPPEYAANAQNIGALGTSNNGALNYTLCMNENGLQTNFYLTSWVSSAYNLGGAFTYTAYSHSLSDAADNAIWQAYFNAGASNGKQRAVYGNYKNWIFVCYDVGGGGGSINPRFTATVFVFSLDFSTYNRYDVTFSSGLNWACYYMDIDGNEYAIGSTFNDGSLLFGGVSGPGSVELSDPIALGCWSPCANLLYRMPQ